MKKFFLFAILSLGTALSLMARDVLYLKNGSVIKGDILEFNMGGSVKIQTSDGSLFVYDSDQVDRAEKEGQGEDEENVDRRFRHKGYRGFADIGLLAFSDDSYSYDLTSAFVFTTSHGYQICPWVFLGAGAGVYVYDYTFYNYGNNKYSYTYKENGTGVIIPFYADVRAFPIGKKRVTPFLGTKLGYAISSLKDSDGDIYNGFYSHFNAGVSVAFKPDFGIHFSIGYSNADFGRWYSNFNGVTIQAGVDF